MESYDVVRQVISNALQNFFLCGIWTFTLFTSMSNLVNGLSIKSKEKKEKALKAFLIVFCIVIIAVSFGMIIHFFKKI